jgi:two-component system, LytTR family, response regulator
MKARAFRVWIVDDEPVARATLRMLLEADPEIEISGEYGSVKESIAAISEQQPDLIFLDIKMGRSDGFKMLEAIGEARTFEVIFVTAHDQFAINAFGSKAIDYVLKPFDDARFRQAVERAKQILRTARLAALAEDFAEAIGDEPKNKQPPLSSIAVRNQGSIELIPVEEVDWIEAQDYYAQVHRNGLKHLVRISLRQLEQKLDPARFVRIHRSAIVNIARISELRSETHGEATVILFDGTKLRLSRTHRRELHARLQLVT